MSATAALAYADEMIGTVETSNNWGGKNDRITKWLKASGYSSPEPWCQCFANAVAVIGGAPAIVNGYTPDFWHGHFASKGYHPIPLSQAQPGDFVYFDWSMFSGADTDHVGILVSMTASTVTCIEGNTSSTSGGSQNNGGGVWRKTRSRSLVRGAVSVPYTGSASAPFRVIASGDEGADVRALQLAVNKRADGCGRADRRCDVDGVCGPETLVNTAWAAYILGVGDSQAEIRSGGITPYVQTLVRDPDARNATQVGRAPERRKQAGCGAS